MPEFLLPPLPDYPVQVTNYLPKEDLSWLVGERARLRAGGSSAVVHCDEASGLHALWRAVDPREMRGRCQSCGATFYWRRDLVPVPKCPTCGLAGRNPFNFSRKPRLMALAGEA